ncbi:MAG: caspase-like domain-containing protein [Bradyrhizobium sp.]|nr:caspase-like domain-containing protein [Bradyrhizobium sp.]
MSRLTQSLLLLLAVLTWVGAAAAQQPQERRIALVVGNGAYAKSPLATAANDAGLIAQTLQAAGFDVIGARDLDADSLRKTFRDFMQKVGSDPTNTVAMVYLSGYGVQLAGENYFIPVDSTINRDTDIPIEGLRVSDYAREFTSGPLKASVFVLDAARQQPFVEGGNPIASGLALVDPAPNSLIAFNAAPGTVAPSEPGPYGAYAQALAEMIRTGGLSLPDVFDRVRLRVSENTKGAQIPWDAQKIQRQFTFFDRAPDAPPVQGTPDLVAAIRNRPMRDFGVQEAFTAALARDTVQGYEDFLVAYPGDPLARRVRAILAARREAITWRRTYLADTPNAYWSYLRRYQDGPHAWDARRRLTILSAALEPPPTFAMIDYDLPPPPPDEVVYVDRPVFYFGDPDFGFAPPPPPPVFFLPPPPPDFVVLTPPYAPVGLFILPQPVFVPIAVYCRPPVYVAPPPNNIIFNNIHNTTVINNTINVAPAAQSNIVTAAANNQTGVAPPISKSLQMKAAAISSGQTPVPQHALIDTNAKTSTKAVFPANATSTSATTTPPPQTTVTKPGAPQGTGIQSGTRTQQGTANLKPGNALPGSPIGAALPAQAGKGNEASKGGALGTTGPGGLTPNNPKQGTLQPGAQGILSNTANPNKPAETSTTPGVNGKPGVMLPADTKLMPQTTTPTAGHPNVRERATTANPANTANTAPARPGETRTTPPSQPHANVQPAEKPAAHEKLAPPVTQSKPSTPAMRPAPPPQIRPEVRRTTSPPPPPPQVTRVAPPPTQQPRMAAPPSRPAPQIARSAPPPPPPPRPAAPPPRPVAPAAKKCPPNVDKC